MILPAHFLTGVEIINHPSMDNYMYITYKQSITYSLHIFCET
jgi:hypothetical protein